MYKKQNLRTLKKYKTGTNEYPKIPKRFIIFVANEWNQ